MYLFLYEFWKFTKTAKQRSKVSKGMANTMTSLIHANTLFSLISLTVEIYSQSTCNVYMVTISVIWPKKRKKELFKKNNNKGVEERHYYSFVRSCERNEQDYFINSDTGCLNHSRLYCCVGLRNSGLLYPRNYSFCLSFSVTASIYVTILGVLTKFNSGF